MNTGLTVPICAAEARAIHSSPSSCTPSHLPFCRKEELGEAHHVLQRQLKAGAAALDLAIGHRGAEGIRHTQWVEQAGFEVLCQRAARLAIEDGGEHVGAQRVVLEHGARGVLELMREEGADPIGDLAQRGFRFMSAAHGQQAADVRPGEILADLRGAFIGKKVH